MFLFSTAYNILRAYYTGEVMFPIDVPHDDHHAKHEDLERLTLMALLTVLIIIQIFFKI